LYIVDILKIVKQTTTTIEGRYPMATPSGELQEWLNGHEEEYPENIGGFWFGNCPPSSTPSRPLLSEEEQRTTLEA
jgi:hypothetical protein